VWSSSKQVARLADSIYNRQHAMKTASKHELRSTGEQALRGRRREVRSAITHSHVAAMQQLQPSVMQAVEV